MARGTAAKASSEREEMNGISITPMTPPAARALFGEASTPRLRPIDRISGATVRTAKKP